MLCNNKITKRLVISWTFLVCVCSLSVNTVLYAAESSLAVPYLNSSSQALIPKVCPAERGVEVSVGQVLIKSESILIPAKKSNVAIPKNTDVITTPGTSSKKVLRISVPSISPASIPDMIKQPITLEQALQIAFQNSPGIQAALSKVENARGSVDAANALFNPTFNLQASTTRQGPISSSAPNIVSPSSKTNLSIALPLDISHQLKYSSEIASYQFQAQYLSMVSVSEQLIVDVKGAYYDLLRACGQMVVSQSSVDGAKLRLENIRAKFEEGAVPKYDVTSAEVEFENLNQGLIAAQNQVYIAQSSLNTVLGVDVNNPTQIISIDVPVTIDSVDIPKSVNEAYARRPEIKAAQSNVTISETSVSLRKTGLMPSLVLSGTPSYNFNPIGSSDNYSWQASAVLSLPLWDGGVTKAKVRQARADVQSAAAALDQTKITVANQVRKSALNLQNSALRTKTTAHAVSLAEDALEIAYDRYNSGIAVLVEVTNAQSQLAQARYNYVNAQYDYAIALAQLQKTTSSQPELNQLQLLAGESSVKSNEKETR